MTEKEKVLDTKKDSNLEEKEIQQQVMLWSKFVKLVNILKSKMVVIMDAYVKGMNMCSFQFNVCITNALHP
jgi:hypothetical protein